MAIRDYVHGLELITTFRWIGNTVAPTNPVYHTVLDHNLSKVRLIECHSMGVVGSSVSNPILFINQQNDLNTRLQLPNTVRPEISTDNNFKAQFYDAQQNTFHIYTPNGLPGPLKLLFQTNTAYRAGQVSVWAEPDRPFMVEKADLEDLRKAIERLVNRLERG